MYVEVRQSFEHAGIFHERGDVLHVMAELKDIVADLLSRGVVIVIEDADDPIRLSTPESGQHLTLRQDGFAGGSPF